MKFTNHKFTQTHLLLSVRKEWSLLGPEGAVSFWHSGYKDSRTCGLEFHMASWCNKRPKEPPSQIRCHILDGPCWHDGTSLYAQETLWPMFKDMTHEEVFKVLESEYERFFEE